MVASMTLPALVQKNNNRVVEARLMKFYSSINQAVKLAEADYGDKTYWFEDLKGAEIDKDGNPVAGSSEAEKWFNKYLAPYMKIIRTETLSDGGFMVYFPDGSALQSRPHTTRDWRFYTGNPDRCRALKDEGSAKCYFVFFFRPLDTNSELWKFYVNKGFEPGKYAWNGEPDDLKKACYTGKSLGDSSVGGKAYCSGLIQLNGWRIPDDYPYKVRY